MNLPKQAKHKLFLSNSKFWFLFLAIGTKQTRLIINSINDDISKISFFTLINEEEANLGSLVGTLDIGVGYLFVFGFFDP